LHVVIEQSSGPLGRAETSHMQVFRPLIRHLLKLSE
jgi:hypothetical protein